MISKYLTKKITLAKIEYYKEKLTGADQGTAFKLMSNILCTSGDSLPDDPPDSALSDQYAVFFNETRGLKSPAKN